MNIASKVAITALAACALAACSPGTQVNARYGATFKNGDLVLQAPSRPDAYITADGTLRIGSRTVDVTPPQRASLKDYYGDSHSILAAGKVAGTAGARLVGHGVVDMIKGFFSSNPAHTGAGFHAQALATSTALDELCGDIQQLRRTQHSLAAQVPAFAPYAAANKAHCTISNTTAHSITVSNGPSGSTTRSESGNAPAKH